jgi:uncharacterized protein
MKKLAAALTALALVAAIAWSQSPAAPRHHVVFQLSEPEGAAWESLDPHVNNMMDVLEKDGGVEVEVVFYGPGLNMLRKTNKKQREVLEAMAKRGVKLSACQNAMKFLKLKTEDLFPFAAQVPSGVTELVLRQEAGWAYIH